MLYSSQSLKIHAHRNHQIKRCRSVGCCRCVVYLEILLSFNNANEQCSSRVGCAQINENKKLCRLNILEFSRPKKTRKTYKDIIAFSQVSSPKSHFHVEMKAKLRYFNGNGTHFHNLESYTLDF